MRNLKYIEQDKQDRLRRQDNNQILKGAQLQDYTWIINLNVLKVIHPVAVGYPAYPVQISRIGQGSSSTSDSE